MQTTCNRIKRINCSSTRIVLKYPNLTLVLNILIFLVFTRFLILVENNLTLRYTNTEENALGAFKLFVFAAEPATNNHDN